jgi:4-alpha-glucanotransferase
MKVLEFAFDPREKTNYLPHRYGKNCVVYTGTHDNETLVQWYAGLDEVSKAFAMDYMNNSRTPIEEMHWDFIRLAMFSTANTCIIPVQDYMGLGAEARMNFPSTLGTNWKWRMSAEMLSEDLIKEIYHLSKLSERLSEECAKAEEEALEAALAAEKAAKETEEA